jgi:hypothetical protein
MNEAEQAVVIPIPTTFFSKGRKTTLCRYNSIVTLEHLFQISGIN